MTTATNDNSFTTPVGRLVQGHPMEPQTKDKTGAPLLTKSGPNQGQPRTQFFFAVAFPKVMPPGSRNAQGVDISGQQNAEFMALWAKMQACAQAGFPAIFVNGQPNRKFAWKYMDGDGVDDDGKANSSKEGFAGHHVLKFSGGFAPKCFHAGMYEPHQQIQDKALIQRGYFIRVFGSMAANGDPSKPGLYLNHSMVELTAAGPIIYGGPDAATAFGAPAGALPPGATALPAAGAMPGAQPAMPGMPPAGVPQLPVTPNAGFPAGPGAMAPAMPGMPQMPAPGMPAVPAAPAEPTKTAAWPQPYTYQQMLAGGWTEQAMRAHGYIL